MMKSNPAPFPFEAMLKQFSQANQSLVNDWQERFNVSFEPNGGFAETYQKFAGALSQHPAQWLELQQNYQASQMKLWQGFLSQGAAETKPDAATKGERLRKADADKQGTNEAGRVRHRHRIDVVQRQPGVGHRALHNGHDGRQVLPRRDLRYHAPEDAMHVLRQDDERLHCDFIARAVQHGCGRLVTRRLDAKNASHRRGNRRNCTFTWLGKMRTPSPVVSRSAT